MVLKNAANQTITQYNVQTGGANGLLNNVAPSATSGVPVISQGAAANPAFGTAVVAGGGTGNTTFTAYSVIAAGTTATGPFQNLSGVGTSGQILASAGAGALPVWTNASALGGSLSLIQTQTGSNVATIDFTTSITSYNSFLIVYDNLSASATTTFQMRVSTDGGSNYLATGYESGEHYIAYNATTWANNNATTGWIVTGSLTNTATDIGSGYCYLLNVIPSGSSVPQIVGSGTIISGNITYNTICAGRRAAATINAIRFLFATGNIKTATISLYGISQ